MTDDDTEHQVMAKAHPDFQLYELKKINTINTLY